MVVVSTGCAIAVVHAFNDIVACQGGRVSIKPVTRTPTRHTLGPFSPFNRWK